MVTGKKRPMTEKRSMRIVLLPWICNTCTLKRCLHRKVDFKTNAAYKAHVSLLFHSEAKLLQNGCFILHFRIKTNTLQLDASHITILGKLSSGLSKNCMRLKSFENSIVLLPLSDGDGKHGSLLSNTPRNMMQRFRLQVLQDPPLCSCTDKS